MFSREFYKNLNNLGIPNHMLNRAEIGFKENWKPIYNLLNQQSIPKEGFNDTQIHFLLKLLSELDSDKDPMAIRIGEREGRISTPILENLSGGFCHGIGRSGQLAAPQPKAAGASIMQNLTNKVVRSLIKKLGLVNIKSALTTPVGTGMALAMALKGTCNQHGINIHKKSKILYCRADHKSPLKGMEFINAEPLIIEGKYGVNHHSKEGSFIDIEDIKNQYIKNKENIFAIVSTTSFFAPRVPDNVKEIARFAEKNNLIHIINNAYGLQNSQLVNLIRSSIDAGRVDAIIQSTDKNFLTPVGGAVIISPNKTTIEEISKCYAGRANAAPIVHLLVSLLSMGLEGYLELMKKQQQNYQLLLKEMKSLARKLNESIIDCNNGVSIAMTLKNLIPSKIERLGGYLYNLRVTGPRVINIEKSSFGSCTNEIPYSYIVINAAIGVKSEHILKSIEKLEQSLTQLEE